MRLPLLAFVIIAAGCNQNNATNNPDVIDDHSTNTADVMDASAPLDGSTLDVNTHDVLGELAPVDAPTHQFNLSIGPLTLTPGDEQTMCILQRAPNETPQFLRRISAHLQSSHHLIVYRSSVTTEQLTPMPCHAFSGVNPQMGLNESPLIIAQQEDAVVQMPEGVGMNIAAHQMLRFELHAINVTAANSSAMGSVTLDTAEQSGELQPADVMLWGNLNIDIAEHAQDARVEFFHQPLAGIHIFALTSHTHRAGVLATISTATNTTGDATMSTDIQELHRSTSWSEPPLTTFADPGLQVPAGQGLHLVCHYNNNSAAPLEYGESAATNEMCFMWAYFWPAPNGEQNCFDLPNAPGTQCSLN